MAKILAGGLPGGALAGRADLMAIFEQRAEAEWNRYRRLYHPGTFNANPLSAAAGIAALEIVATGQPHATANALGGQLRAGLNEVLRRRGVRGCVYGEGSVFHIHLGKAASAGSGVACLAHDDPRLFLEVPSRVTNALRGAMLAQGIDLMRTSGFVSAAHKEDDIAQTIAAFDKTLEVVQSSCS